MRRPRLRQRAPRSLNARLRRAEGPELRDETWTNDLGGLQATGRVPIPALLSRSTSRRVYGQNEYLNGPESGAMLVAMQALKGHVKNGQIVLDEPAELPEGMEVSVQVYDPEGDMLSDEDRAALHRSLRRGIAEADAGELIESEEVLAEFER